MINPMEENKIPPINGRFQANTKMISKINEGLK